MNDEYCVKGSSIRSKFQFVREHFGTAAEQRLQDRFPSSFFPILDSNWYPYSFYEQVVRAITEQVLHGKVERLEEVGVFSARSVLTTIYSFLASGKDFVDFLKRAETLHHSVYNRGSMTVEVAEDRRSCVIRLSAPVFRDIDMHISAGFYLGAARHLGAREVRCKKSLGDNRAEFRLSWV